MKVMIAGASGFIGQKLTKKWIGQGVDVVAIGRSTTRLTKAFGPSVEALTWQNIAENPEKFIDKIDVIFNLAGTSVAGGLWTEQRKKEILQSRIESTKTLSSFSTKCYHNKPVFLNASAIGIYGLQKYPSVGPPPVFDENSPIDVNNISYLAHVCRQWEAATQTAIESGSRVIHMRFGHVLGKEGGMLEKMALPFSLGLGCVLGAGKQMMSWISLDDLCSVIQFLIDHQQINGPVNCVCPNPVTNREFAKALARALKKPCFLQVPGGFLKMILREMADELFLNSQYIKPTVLLEEGFSFKDRDIGPFLERTLT